LLFNIIIPWPFFLLFSFRFFFPSCRFVLFTNGYLTARARQATADHDSDLQAKRTAVADHTTVVCDNSVFITAVRNTVICDANEFGAPRRSPDRVSTPAVGPLTSVFFSRAHRRRTRTAAGLPATTTQLCVCARFCVHGSRAQQYHATYHFHRCCLLVIATIPLRDNIGVRAWGTVFRG